MMWELLITLVGLFMLILGAEGLVRGASLLARLFGISSLIVGLTIVAFGTSAPELAVSVKAGLESKGGISIGNVLGSNTFNILFILGVSALATPLFITQRLVRVHVPVMIFVSALVWFFARNGVLGRSESVVLFGIFTFYVAGTIFFSRGDAVVQVEDIGVSPPRMGIKSVGASLFGVVMGLVLLIWGARLFVNGASQMARYLGVDDLTIGLTIVAAGTSLPEVATSLVASVRGERDIAVGNVVGSNIFNLLCVLGISGAVARHGLVLPVSALEFDLPVMLAASVVCLPVFVSGAMISRGEGAFLLGYYLLYLALLILRAVESVYVQPIAGMLIYFILPATGLLLLISLMRGYMEVRTLLLSTADDLLFSGRLAIRNMRRIVVLVVGITLLLLGVAMMVLPGPAILVIPMGLALLGTEFLWARRLLRYIYEEAQTAARRITDMRDGKE